MMIREGSPIVTISFVDVKRDKIRGECCEGKAPDALPAFASRHVTAPQMTKLKNVSTEGWWQR